MTENEKKVRQFFFFSNPNTKISRFFCFLNKNDFYGLFHLKSYIFFAILRFFVPDFLDFFMLYFDLCNE
jgi:hypothetical protein